MLHPNIIKLSETKYLVPSNTVPRRSHTVEKRLGVWICSCKGFLLSCINNNTNCKHLDYLFRVKPELTIIPQSTDSLRVSSLGDVL